MSDYDVIFTPLGGEYKAQQNRCCELVVLPKFHSKAFFKRHEYPSADDFEGKKRLQGVYTALFIVKWFTVADFLYAQCYVYHYRRKQGRLVNVL